VLEIPHRMGLQYFEALSPATIASIVAVLCNRLVTGNDVTGYFSYPFLTATLPSEIFTNAIIYGLFGAGVGIIYANGVKFFKGSVHDWFHASHDDLGRGEADAEGPAPAVSAPEQKPLLPKGKKHKGKRRNKHTCKERLHSIFCLTIPDEKVRATVAGTLAGAITGVICMFVPHCLFWGEDQLQSLIDKGRTPLPVFGRDSEPTAGLTHWGLCMIDPNDLEAIQAGFTVKCSALISIAKIVVTGLSIGTGVIGGHFWGPLFVGCCASHLFTDICSVVTAWTGVDLGLASYPCVAILCVMGSAHVVTYRAHMSIMLILTLTISAFDPEEDVSGNYAVAGDYSAVFPLLVVSVFVSLMVSRQTVFYNTQRSRGDIMAVPEVLCEPGMEGRPLVYGYDDVSYDISDVDWDDTEEEGSLVPSQDAEFGRSDGDGRVKSRLTTDNLTQDDIEAEFEQQTRAIVPAFQDQQPISSQASPLSSIKTTPEGHALHPLRVETNLSAVWEGEKPQHNVGETGLSSSRLDELLGLPLEVEKPVTKLTPRARHRRIQSAPVHPKENAAHKAVVEDIGERLKDRSLKQRDPSPSGNRERSNSSTGGGGSRRNLLRITSYGELAEHQPSLMEQARIRAASSNVRHRRVPSLPSGRHARKDSHDSASFFSSIVGGGGAGGGGGSGVSSSLSGGTTSGTSGGGGRHARKNSFDASSPSSASSRRHSRTKSSSNITGGAHPQSHSSTASVSGAIPMMMPPSGRHSRKNSSDSGTFSVTAGSGALTMDDFEQSFTSRIKEMANVHGPPTQPPPPPPQPKAFGQGSPWTSNSS